MKSTNKFSIKAFLLMMAAVFTLASCSDDDTPTLESLSSSDITVTTKTVSKLSFQWNAVENATQYGYRLVDADGEAVDGGVTTDTEATFTGLDDDTEYTFELTAFAKYNDRTYKNADPITLSVSTEKIVPLDTPSPVGEVKNEKITVSWDAVDNADTYYVKTVCSDGTESGDTVTTTSYSFTGVVGNTYSVSVSADTDDEAYSQSEWGTVEDLVPVKSEATELWRVTGSFYDAGEYQETYTRTLVAYSDGTYKLLDWIYGGSGLDLEFSVKDNGEIEVLNGGTPSNGYIPVEFYPGYTCYVYTTDGCSSFDATAGTLEFYAYGYSQGTSKFTWNPSDIVYAGPKEIWRVTGSFFDAAVYNETYTRTLVAYEDGTYKLLDWIYAGSGCDLEFSVTDAGEIEILNGGTPYGSYIPVEYYSGYSCYVYTTGGYSKFNATKGDLWFYAYSTTEGYSEFTWNTADVVYAE